MRFIVMIVTALFAALPALAGSLPEITVWKSPHCGCCSKWIDHLRAAGFSVKAIDRVDVEPIKQQYGVPQNLGSCHTALVGGYVVEGHVPADTIKRLLKEKPKVLGLSVPGMPQGSPGMESPTPQPYNVIAFDERGRMSVFEKR